MRRPGTCERSGLTWTALTCQHADDALVEPHNRKISAVGQSVLVTAQCGPAESPAHLGGYPEVAQRTPVEISAASRQYGLVGVVKDSKKSARVIFSRRDSWSSGGNGPVSYEA